MEKTFQLLANIQRVTPEKDLWQGILNKKNAVQKLPLTYVSAAAACFVLFVSAEVFFIQNDTKTAENAALTNLLPSNNTILSYE